MKHLKKLAVVLVLFVAATSAVQAQSKVAHINVQELLSQMPKMKNAMEELKKLEATHRATLEASMTELKNKYTQYENEAAYKSDEENQKRAQELQGYQKGIQEAEQAAAQDINKKRGDLLGPITEEAKAAIEKVAAAKGVDYVIDASQGGGLIVAKGTDIMADVKKELGF